MRARNIKPGFFENEELADLDPLARILFIGLWCIADREGRFEWRPKRIKALILPYDECDVEGLMMSLHAMTFIDRYSVGGQEYGEVVNFLRHQKPHPHEAKTRIPKKPEQNQCHDIDGQCHEMSPKCSADIMNVDVMNDESITTSTKGPLPETERNVRETVEQHRNIFLSIGPFTESELEVEVEAIVEKTRDRPLGNNAFSYIKDWLYNEKGKKERRNAQRNSTSTRTARGTAERGGNHAAATIQPDTSDRSYWSGDFPDRTGDPY